MNLTAMICFMKLIILFKKKKTATAMNPQKMPASLLIFLHQAYKSLTKASAALACPDEQNNAKTF